MEDPCDCEMTRVRGRFVRVVFTKVQAIAWEDRERISVGNSAAVEVIGRKRKVRVRESKLKIGTGKEDRM